MVKTNWLTYYQKNFCRPVIKFFSIVIPSFGVKIVIRVETNPMTPKPPRDLKCIKRYEFSTMENAFLVYPSVGDSFRVFFPIRKFFPFGQSCRKCPSNTARQKFQSVLGVLKWLPHVTPVRLSTIMTYF